MTKEQCLLARSYRQTWLVGGCWLVMACTLLSRSIIEWSEKERPPAIKIKRNDKRANHNVTTSICTNMTSYAPCPRLPNARDNTRTGMSRKRCLALLSFSALQSPALAFSPSSLSTKSLISFPPKTLSIGSPAHFSTHLYASASDVSNDNAEDFLQSLTVKQLKDRIKELAVPVKMSQLKLKADCVDFLVKHYSSQASETKSEPMEVNDNTAAPARRKKSLAMPPLDSAVAASSTAETAKEAPAHISPKDIIFEKVLRRYPPLRNLQAAIETQKEEIDDNALSAHMHPNFYRSFTGLGDMDVRQKYHPMLENMTSSDLDLITIGTASCVPGVTRGVSCTALRLQWRRNTGNTRDSRGPSNGPVTGGIWIFDCGESTQVRIILFVHYESY